MTRLDLGSPRWAALAAIMFALMAVTLLAHAVYPFLAALTGFAVSTRIWEATRRPQSPRHRPGRPPV